MFTNKLRLFAKINFFRFVKPQIKYITEAEDYVYITGIRKREFMEAFEVKRDQSFSNLCREIKNKQNNLNKIPELLKTYELFDIDMKRSQLTSLLSVLASYKYKSEFLLEFIREEFPKFKDILILITYPYIVNYMTTVKESYIPLNAKLFEKTLLEKGVLLNLKEISEIVRHFDKMRDSVSDKALTYIERVIMHNLDNANLNQQRDYKSSVRDLLRFNNKISDELIDKILSVIVKQIKADDYTLTEINNFIEPLFFKSMIEKSFGSRKPLISKFLGEIKEKIYELVQKEKFLDPTNIESLILVAFNYQEILQMPDQEALGPLLLNLALNNEKDLTINSVCNLLQLYTKIKPHQSNIFKNRIENIFNQNLKNITLISHVRSFLYFAVKIKTPKSVIKYLELSFVKLLLNLTAVRRNERQDISQIIFIFNTLKFNHQLSGFSLVVINSLVDKILADPTRNKRLSNLYDSDSSESEDESNEQNEIAEGQEAKVRNKKIKPSKTRNHEIEKI